MVEHILKGKFEAYLGFHRSFGLIFIKKDDCVRLATVRLLVQISHLLCQKSRVDPSLLKSGYLLILQGGNSRHSSQRVAVCLVSNRVTFKIESMNRTSYLSNATTVGGRAYVKASAEPTIKQLINMTHAQPCAWSAQCGGCDALFGLQCSESRSLYHICTGHTTCLSV